MAQPITSTRRAKALSLALFFLGLAIIAFQYPWWPSIMLVIGISLGLKHYLIGQLYDMTLTLIVFIGAFITGQFNISWDVLLPVVFILAAIYILAKEFIQPPEKSDVDREEDLEREIQEDEKDDQ